MFEILGHSPYLCFRSFGDKSKPPDLGKELELSRGLQSDMDHNKKAQADINTEEGATGGSDVASFVKEFEDLNITENVSPKCHVKGVFVRCEYCT